MKIWLRTLQDGSPKAVREAYDPKELELEFVDLAYLEQIVLDGTVEKFRETLTVRGTLTTSVEHTCARCLKGVEEQIRRPFEKIYDVQGKDELDAVEDVREILIMDHPIRFLCREDCLGLCPHCGGNLSESPCACPRS